MENTLMLGKIEGKRRRGLQRMRWLDCITDSKNMKLSKLLEILKDRRAWHAAVYGAARSQTWLGDWTTTIISKVHSLRSKSFRDPGVLCTKLQLVGLIFWTHYSESYFRTYGLGPLQDFSCVFARPGKSSWHKACNGLAFYAMLSCFSHVWLCATPWTAAHQAPLSQASPGKNTGVDCCFLLQCIL